jgi:pullulanase/glycogen debranching enzyme
LKDLLIYELMIDDFTAEFRGQRAPLDAIRDRLDYLQDLGVNAIEFMPWTAWPGQGFSWGYDPFAFFSVEYRYYNDPSEPLDKLFRLQRLINELHDRGMHVIMDGVFNHVQAGISPDRGFPYSWLYHFPGDSPFIGNFEGGGFFEDFDFQNECTAQFIIDVCKYWIEQYKVDGIRFDYVKGFYREAEPATGISRVIRDLNAYSTEQGLENLTFTLEFLTDNRYEAVGRTNEIRAHGCWYDPLMYQAFESGRSGHVNTPLMRALNAGKDFDGDRRPITYVENHDHSTLTEQTGGRGVWWRTQPAAIALLTCCGAPMLHNGQEFGEQYWFPEEGGGRVMPRQLRWARSTDEIGNRLRALYRRLIAIRKAHAALASANCYPEPYDERWTRFNPEGYGIDESRDLAIYHRWGHDEGGRLERFIIALNFSAFNQPTDIPFSENGAWEDLLNGGVVQVNDFWLRDQMLSSHWGRIYFRRG